MIDRSLFDEIHDRRNSNSVKYNSGPARNNKSVIPMWIADMDFKSPAEVEKAIVDAASQGIYGYEGVGSEYDTLIKNWYKKRMGWEISDKRLLNSPGVMFSVAAAIRALSDPGDAVMIFQPVYYPFANTVKANNRKLVISDLVRNEEGCYGIDFNDMEDRIRKEKVKILLFCSPHNPVGRVWKDWELKSVADICTRNNVKIISDEIHSDFILKGKHIPMAAVSKEAESITVTCVSPTKTFNLAGLNVSSIVVDEPDMRTAVKKELNATSFWGVNMMGAAASNAAYGYGEEWLDMLLDYLRDNVELLSEAFPEGSVITHVDQEGTYLSWLDCRNMGVDEPASLILEKTGVWLHEGSVFGDSGKGYVRMNIACPRSVLKEACSRIQKEFMCV